MQQKLRIGADNFPPYQYLDDAGALRGLDYEAVRDAGIKAGFGMEFALYEWAVAEELFADKQLDALFQMPKTPEREKKWHFSKPLRSTNVELITGYPMLNIADMSDIQTHGYRLGLVEGISYNGSIKSVSAERITFYKDNEKLLKAVSAGQVSFGLCDQGVKQFLIDKLSLHNIRVIPALTFSHPLYIAFHDTEIRDQFDRYLE